MRKAEIKMHNALAGYLIEDENGYHFQYHKAYTGEPVSKTLPLKKEVYTSNVLFPFFDGLIPEGWLLEIAEKNWKLNPRDRMGLLLVCCKDTIGAVSITELKS
jgi:serine/threonine-protein kinase HipA